MVHDGVLCHNIIDNKERRRRIVFYGYSVNSVVDINDHDKYFIKMSEIGIV
jgi:hypothetical protein